MNTMELSGAIVFLLFIPLLSWSFYVLIKNKNLKSLSVDI